LWPLKIFCKHRKRLRNRSADPSQEEDPTFSLETLIHSVSLRPSHERNGKQDKVADARKEQCSRIGGGAVLAEETQMVASEKGLQAHADVPITMVLSQLDCLVCIAVSVA